MSLIFHIPHCDRFCANGFKNGNKVKNFVWNIVLSVWRSEQGELLYSLKYFGFRKAFGQCSFQITFNASINVNSTKTPTKPCLNAKVVGSPNSKHLRESLLLVNGRQYSIPKIIKLFITNPHHHSYHPIISIGLQTIGQCICVFCFPITSFHKLQGPPTHMATFVCVVVVWGRRGMTQSPAIYICLQL